MKLWFTAIVSVVAIALVVWVSAHRTSVPAQVLVTTDVPLLESAETALGEAPPPSERSALGETISPIAESPLELYVSTTPHIVKVRSSTGIELNFIYVLFPSGEWELVDVTNGAVDLGSFPLPCQVRAQGHLIATLEKDAQELVFEPDALFVVHAPGLRSRFPDDRVTGVVVGEGILPVLTTGFIDDDHWVAAVEVVHQQSDAELEQNGGEVKRRLGFNLDSKLGNQISGECTLRSGQRITWDVELEPAAETAPLVVHLKSSGEQNIKSVKFDLSTVDRVQNRYTETQFPWGHVSVPSPRAVYRTREPRVVDGQFRIDSVPLDTKLRLSVRSENDTSHATLEFVHDGSPRTLTLQDDPIVRGTIQFGGKPGWVLVEWRSPTGVLQGSDVLHVETANSSTFKFSGWKKSPSSQQPFSTGLPEQLDVVVSAAGHRIQTLSVSRMDPNIYDCGVIELAPDVFEPWFHVKSGSIHPRNAQDASYCRTDAEPLRRLPIHVGDSSASGWPVYLDATRDEIGVAKLLEVDSKGGFALRELPSAPGEKVVIYDGYAALCLQRASVGEYVAVETVTYRVHLTSSSDVTFVAWWTWHDFNGEPIRRSDGRTWRSDEVMEFRAPKEGCVLRWQYIQSNAEVHRVPLDRTDIELDAH